MNYLILLCFLILSPLPAHATPAPQIRVALVQATDLLRLSGRNFYCFLPGTPASEQTRLPRRAALIRHTGAGFLLDTQFLQGSALECLSGEGLLSVNDTPIQGHLTLVSAGPQTVMAILSLPLEQYLIGVLQGELGQNWPPEALKAQAIAARSYALSVMQARRHQPFDVATTTRDQVYTASIQVPTPIQAAVLDTQGQVLRYHGQILRAFYHSCCGGKGVDFQTVWKDLAPGKAAIPFPEGAAKDPFCRKAPVARWEHRTLDGMVIQSLRPQSPSLAAMNQIEFQRASDGRIASVALPGKTTPLSGNEFRKLLGYDKVKSTQFTVKQRGHTVTFSGRGYGHGVGLCQWGARGMAEKGKTAPQILQFYYPGTELTRAY